MVEDFALGTELDVAETFICNGIKTLHNLDFLDQAAEIYNPWEGARRSARLSKQTFGAEKREAIWTAYGRKCVYTGVLLDPHSMHIDHVIRESLLDDPPALEQLKSILGLPPDFDVLGFETWSRAIPHEICRRVLSTSTNRRSASS